MWYKNSDHRTTLEIGHGFIIDVYTDTYEWMLTGNGLIIELGGAVSVADAKQKAIKVAHQRLNLMISRLIQAS